jgi:hypothetical protein
MTIRAKYRGRCKHCHQPIQVGEEIEWRKGWGAAHVDCQAQEDSDRSVKRMAAGGNAKRYGKATAKGSITAKQAAFLRRAQDAWFDIFDGIGPYGTHGPSDAQIAAMSRREASEWIGAIKDDGGL